MQMAFTEAIACLHCELVRNHGLNGRSPVDPTNGIERLASSCELRPVDHSME